MTYHLKKNNEKQLKLSGTEKQENEHFHHFREQEEGVIILSAVQSGTASWGYESGSPLHACALQSWHTIAANVLEISADSIVKIEYYGA